MDPIENNENMTENRTESAMSPVMPKEEPKTAPKMENTEAPKAEVGQNTIMAILAYIGPLVIVSYVMAKDEPFVKFHIKQGLVLFISEVVLWFIMSAVYMLWPIIQIVHLGIIVLSILGIINAVQGKEKELPIVGKWGESFKI